MSRALIVILTCFLCVRAISADGLTTEAPSITNSSQDVDTVDLVSPLPVHSIIGTILFYAEIVGGVSTFLIFMIVVCYFFIYRPQLMLGEEQNRNQARRREPSRSPRREEQLVYRGRGPGGAQGQPEHEMAILGERQEAQALIQPVEENVAAAGVDVAPVQDGQV